MDPKVARIMGKMKYEPGEGSKLPDFRGQTTRKGLGYKSDEEKSKVKKKGLKLMDCFVKASRYQWEPEPVEVNGIVVPGFEIFQDVIGKKPTMDKAAKNEEEKWEEELMKLGSLTIEEEKKLGKAPVVEEEVSMSDEDIYLPDLFECTSALSNNKDISFAYLPESFSFTLHESSIFDISSAKTNAFNLGTPENPKEILIASEVTTEEREKLEEVLIRYAKVFAWSYEDMPGVDRSIAQHTIPTYPNMRPVKQKLRRMRPEWAEKVREEVKK